MDFARELQTAIRTGKVVIGTNETKKAMLLGKSRLVILAANAPDEVREDIKYYAKVSKTPVYTFPGSSWDLGAICRRPHMVASLAIIDPGESSILELTEEE